MEIMNNVLAHTDSDIPEVLNDKDVAKAFYGLTVESLSDKIKDAAILKEVSTQTALKVDELVQEAVLDNGIPIIDWDNKTGITGKLVIDIGDFLIDDVRDKYGIELSFGEMDEIANKFINVAITRYK
jgi:type I restriction enzyme R subunit